MLTLKNKTNVLRYAFRHMKALKPTSEIIKDFRAMLKELGILLINKGQFVHECKVNDEFGEERTTEVNTKNLFELKDVDSGETCLFEINAKGRAEFYGDHLSESDKKARQDASEKAMYKLLLRIITES